MTKSRFKQFAYEAASKPDKKADGGVRVRTTSNHGGKQVAGAKFENAIVDAMDMKEVLVKHATWVNKLRAGHIDASQFLQGLAPDVAVELLGIAMRGESEKTRLEAIKDFLDRAGLSKVNKIAMASVDASQPKEQLIAMVMGLAGKSKAIEITEDESSEPEDGDLEAFERPVTKTR